METNKESTETAIPILLFDGECGVCRRIGHWVQTQAIGKSGEKTIDARPIGDDPIALRELNPRLDIWDAYETIHVVLPDGSMLQGGEAVAEVLRRLKSTQWFAGSFNVRILGGRPFQSILNGAFALLSDVRPLFGCESCGTSSAWIRPLKTSLKCIKAKFGVRHHPSPHFTPAVGPKKNLLPR